ncbi:MAG: energy-coupling factor transporter ATPase [Clostridiales Family XIII bacterium]|jgi:energy-coupling factor transport system ATP-binding protein|nr:energy-coupling factor transporter ATPase [Clostridiales Family XIII bacterium]
MQHEGNPLPKNRKKETERLAQDSIIQIHDLVYTYRHREEEINLPAINGISLDVERGSFTAVIGRNGSGKSTLAKSINALVLPTSGSVIVDGFKTDEEAHLWDVRQRVGMVFQNPDNQLVSAIVEDDVAFGPENLGINPDEIRTRIRIALESVDMYEHRKMAPHLLSGGQKQRIAIAGVLAMHPDIVIFDEPTAMLDPGGRKEVLDIMKQLHEEGITVVLITHFMEETIHCDRIVILDKGRVAIEGSPVEIFARTEEIEALGLRLPFAVEIAAGLRAHGIHVPQDILDTDGLVKYIVSESDTEMKRSKA